MSKTTKCVCGMDKKYCVCCELCKQYWCGSQYCNKVPALVLTNSGYYCVVCIKTGTLIFPESDHKQYFMPLEDLIQLAQTNHDFQLLYELNKFQLL